VIAYISGTVLRTPADVGALIRDRRRALGLDQADLANQVGVSRLWINQVERGKPGASIGLVLRTLMALGLELSTNARGKTPTPAVTLDIDAVVEAASDKRRQ
jgi:HTH-type transcriptional regulator/antitoxin HipB